jgi:predicted Zn-dependent protease
LKKQWFATGIGALLALVLYFGISNKPPKKSVYTVLSEKLIDSLDLPEEEQIIIWQKKLKNASAQEKPEVLTELANLWKQAGYASIAGDYLRQKADYAPDYEIYFEAGNTLFSSLQADTSRQMRMNVVYGARYCYEKALELNPANLEAKISLGTLLVQGTSNPMEGVQLLKEVETEDPGNIAANILLGEFSMMSGQFDKAAERFQTVLEKDSLNLQARYGLAECYIVMNDTVLAIRTLEEVIPFMQDTILVNRINQNINSLKNN